MTVSILESIRKRPGGSVDPGEFRWSNLGGYLSRHYLNSEIEKDRREKAAQRQRLYQCNGDTEMLAMLRQVFRNDEVIELRRQWIEFAKYNNVIRRVCNELATCYSAPATRKVEGGTENQARYKEVQRLCRLDEVMQRINPLLILHRALVIVPRMRQTPAGTWEPVIDVVTPASFSAVRDPIDPTQLLALIFENDYLLADGLDSGPKWTVLTWHETFMVSSHCEVIEKTVTPHGLGRIPALLLTLEPPEGRLIDTDTGADLVAAQLAIWFLNVLHLKECKSATVQVIVQGDMSQVARNQVNDTDATGSLSEGTSINTIDRGMDVSIFITGASHIGETTGSNYGLSPAILNGDSVQSADARELQRIPLRELRLRQQIPFREFERELAELMSVVVAQRRPDLQYDTDGWSIDFADPQTPLGTKEALDVFEKERQLTLSSTKREVKRRNPDLDDDAAEDFIAENIADELERNLAMRPLQRVNGSPAAEMAGGDIPGQPPGAPLANPTGVNAGTRDDAPNRVVEQLNV